MPKPRPSRRQRLINLSSSGFSQPKALRRLQRVSALRRQPSRPSRPRKSRLHFFLNLLPVVLLFLSVAGVFVGRRYTQQKLDVEKTIRAQLIPALEKQLGKKVEVGKIESDYLTRFVLSDVVIGRDGDSPLGALLQARKITIYLDVVNLVLHREDPLGSISRVILEAPQVDLRRDAAGLFNLAALFKTQGGPQKQWNGLVEFDDGRVYYQDEILRSARGRKLVADARDISGRLRLNGAAPLRYDISLPETRIAGSDVPIRSIHGAGTASPNFNWFVAAVRCPRAPAPLLTEYAFRRREVVARSGQISANVHVMWDKALPPQAQFAVQGEAFVLNVSGYAQALKEPGTTRPLMLANASGQVRLTDKSFETPGFSVRALNTNLRAKGSFTFLPTPSFDGTVSLDGIEVNRLIELARRSDPNANSPLNTALRDISLRAGALRGTARLTGNTSSWAARAKVALAYVAVSHRQWGALQAAAPSADVTVHSNAAKLVVKAALRTGNVRAAQNAAGEWRGSGPCNAEVLWDGAHTPSPLQVKFAAASIEGSQKQMGRWRGANVAGLMRWSGRSGDVPAVRVSVQKLAGRHPSTGVLGARDLQATVNWRGANFVVAATAGSAMAQNAALGAFGSGSLKIGAQGNLQSGAASVEVFNARGRNRELGAAQFARLQAVARWNGSQINARWNARGAALQNPQSGSWRTASLRGTGTLRSAGRANAVSVDVEARNFAGGQSRYGFWKGGAIRIVAATPNAARGPWNGVAAAGDIDTRRANLAAISPSVANQVRDAGLVTGKARFTGLLTDNPVVKGRARLSQATLVQEGQVFALRDIETAVAIGDDNLRLTGMKAQSPYGPVQGEIQNEFKTGRLRFAILAPRVQLSAEQLNGYLKNSGLSIEGDVVARLKVSAGGEAGFSRTSVPADAHTRMQVQFEVALPKGRTKYRDRSTPRAQTLVARTQDARLRGEGVLRFNDAENWGFNGNINLDAAHLANEAPAGTANEVRAANLRIVTRGTLNCTRGVLTPFLAGEVQAGSVLVPLAGQAPLPLSQASVEFVAQKGEVQLPRFTASSGNAKVTGHAHFEDVTAPRSSLSGEVLLEKFDAARARALLVSLQGDESEDIQIPQVNGTLYARADFNGNWANGRMETVDLNLQTRLYSGLVRWTDYAGQGNVLPIDAARFATTLKLPLASNTPLALDNLAVWTDGARLAAHGEITPQGNDYALNLDASLHTLRLRHLMAVPMLRTSLQSLADESGFEGLLSGEFKIGGTAAAPDLKGRAALRLARAFGFDIAAINGNIEARPAVTPEGAPTFYIALNELQGNFAGAPAGSPEREDEPASANDLRGKFIADGAANEWNLELVSPQISSAELMLAAVQAGDARTRGWRDIPLTGSLKAGIKMRGTLRDDEGRSHFLPVAGFVDVQSGEGDQRLRWHGREMGVLNAQLQLQNGVLQARRFSLVREQGASPAEPQSSFEIRGVLPVSLDTPDLEAQLSIKNQPLSFGLEVLHEIRDALQKRGQNVSYLDTVLRRIDALPANTDGRFDMEAQLEQSWRMPVVAVRSLSVSDTYFRTPSGTRKALPNLQAAFVYDSNDRGAVSIQNAELRLPRADKGGEPGSDAASQDDDDDEDDADLLIRTLRPGRIVPDGELSLQAEVLNADLEQLADWLPTMRGTDGRPVLRGRLSDFVVQLSGTTIKPEVTGSLLGENWEFRDYSLDRVRLDQFTIRNGQLRVEPGYLTVVKGDFQSAAAWGYLPWNWGEDGSPPGPIYDKALEVHFPIGNENFGALAGVFLPAMQNVGADSFSGAVTVTGTLNEPRLAGEATINNGTFRIRPAYSELDAGFAGLSGTLRFVDGNRLEIAESGLRGRLVPASEVQAPSTGNAPSEVREERDEKRERENKSTASPQLAGDFLLEGGVTFDLDPSRFIQSQRSLAFHRYDLRLALHNALYSSPDFSGVRQLNGVMVWKTGAGAPQNSQNIRWAFTAAGDGSGKDKAGRLSSFVSLQLTPGFSQSLDSLLRAQAKPFSQAGEFEELLTAAAADSTDSGWAELRKLLTEAQGQPSRISLQDFRFSWKNVARGLLQGNILIDNGTSTRQPPPIPFENASPEQNPLLPASIELVDGSDGGARSSAGAAQGTVEAAAPPVPSSTPRVRGRRGGNRGNSRSAGPGEQAPLRLSGDLNLLDAELYGAPADADTSGAGEVKSVFETGFALPEAPVFDMKISAGRNVQFVSSNLRATITGDLEASGTPRDPVIYGTLYTRGGQITFPNARARLISGELTVAARRDPVSGAMRLRVEIDATARGRSGRYEITLRLRGPLDTGVGSTQDLRVDISSSPPLSQDEAFSQLLGTAVVNRGNLDGEQNENYARALVGLFSGPLFSGLERSLERVLGLDSIALDYRIDEPIGVEVGKAIGDRLYISYRRALQSSPGQKTPFDLRIEYRLKGDVELGLQTDESSITKLTIQKRWRF